jgi:HEAT repeat protein
MPEPEARRKAASKLCAILDDLIRAGETIRAIAVIEALGLTGSELAGERLVQLYDQTESTDIEDAVIRALGEVGRHATSNA